MIKTKSTLEGFITREGNVTKIFSSKEKSATVTTTVREAKKLMDSMK